MLTGIHPRPPITGPGAPGGNDHRTVLLVHSDTTHGSTTFIDSGHGSRYVAAPHVITPVSGAQHSTTKQKIGATGIDVTGAKYVSVPWHPNFDLNGLEEWTVDFLWNPSSTPSSGQVGNLIGAVTGAPTTGWHIWQDNALGTPRPGGIKMTMAGGGTIGENTLSSAWTVGIWYHVAFVRIGFDWMHFKDGLLARTLAMATPAAASATTLKIGNADATPGTPVPASGYLDEIRFSNWARWRGDFTPDTTPYER